MSCGGLEYIVGGTIKDSTIINSEITGSRVSNSTLESSDITALKSVDTASAQVLATALSQLSAGQLKDLATALWAALDLHQTATTAPSSSAESTLPTDVYGDRSKLLGNPDTWMDTELGVVPVYNK